MYFTVINAAIGVFFLFLIVIGLLLKYHSFLPINILGILIVLATIYIDYATHLTPGNVILIMLSLVIIFITDVIFIFRDFKEEVSEEQAHKLKLYLPPINGNEHFKLIRDENFIKSDINSQKRFSLPDRVQALELMRQGNQYFLKGNFQEALEKYDLSCNLVESGAGYLNQSGVLLQSHQYEDALVLAEKAEQLRPKFYEALLNQAVALEKMDKLPDALNKYEAAAKLKPEDDEIWFCLANTYFKLEKYDEAVKYFDRALELNGKYFEAWYLKGISLQRTGKLTDALRCFENSLALKPRHAKSYFRMGNILADLERESDAISAYEKSIRLNPDFDVCWNNLGVVLNKIGRVKDAIACYERAIKLNNHYAEAWFNRALAYDTLDKWQKALESYQQFSKIAGQDMEKRKETAQKRIGELKNKMKKKKGFLFSGKMRKSRKEK